MYLVAGMVARSVAGPGVVISFIIAAIASIFSGELLTTIFPNRNHQTRMQKKYKISKIHEFHIPVREMFGEKIVHTAVEEFVFPENGCFTVAAGESSRPYLPWITWSD